jgi:hypothetical protein
VADRDAQILRLLDTRFDNLPEPTRRTNATAGFVHNDLGRVTCPDCLANDRVMYGCETCGGRGYTEELRERDPYAVNATRVYGLTGAQHDARVARDAQIARAGKLAQEMLSSLTDELEAANANPYGWEEARRRMYEQFDYAALDRALDALHEVQPGLSPRSIPALAFLSQRLPNPLRAPATEKEVVRQVSGPLRPEAGKATKEIRDAAMRARAGEGATVVELATEFRVSIRTVYNVVNTEKAA